MNAHETALAEVKRALEAGATIIALSSELCDAVDAEAEDVGTGPRSSLVVLREIGPIVTPAKAAIDKALALLSTLSLEPARPDPVRQKTELEEDLAFVATPPAAKADDLVEVVRVAIATVRGHAYPHDDLYARAVLTALDIPRREAEAAEREREECAKIAKNIYGGRAPTYSGDNAQIFRVEDATCGRIYAAIRARSQPAGKAQGGEE